VRLYRVSAIVIRQRDLGEADRIVIFYTRERGKLSAVAKGIKRPRSKLAGSLQLFTHAKVQLAAGRSLEVATQAEATDVFYHLRDDMARYAHASYAAELLDALTDEGLPEEDLFDLLLETLRALEAGGDPATIARAFELKLLDQLGYGVELEVCVGCGAKIAGEGQGFSVAHGGVMCSRCTGAQGGTALSGRALQALRELLVLPMAEVAKRRLSAAAREELERLLRPFVDYRLERPLRSAVFLKGDV
jgi:DNA repair protein RecO (recombination protein O)